MNDRVVFLYKKDFTEEAWQILSYEFSFADEKTMACIHIILDSE